MPGVSAWRKSARALLESLTVGPAPADSAAYQYQRSSWWDGGGRRSPPSKQKGDQRIRRGGHAEGGHE